MLCLLKLSTNLMLACRKQDSLPYRIRISRYTRDFHRMRLNIASVKLEFAFTAFLYQLLMVKKLMTLSKHTFPLKNHTKLFLERYLYPNIVVKDHAGIALSQQKSKDMQGQV